MGLPLDKLLSSNLMGIFLDIDKFKIACYKNDIDLIEDEDSLEKYNIFLKMMKISLRSQL